MGSVDRWNPYVEEWPNGDNAIERRLCNRKENRTLHDANIWQWSILESILEKEKKKENRAWYSRSTLCRESRHMI